MATDESTPVELIVLPGIPVAGPGALACMAVLVALIGAVMLTCRRERNGASGANQRNRAQTAPPPLREQ
jgi:hypothetical protein